MSLAQALGNALTGLRVNQQQLANLSQNISNANTKGYTRKIVDQASNVIAGAGFGVKVEDITRKVDEYLTRAVQQQSGQYGQADIVAEFQARLQVLLGKPGSLDSFDATTSGFFNTLQQLAESPESGALKLSGVNAGMKLARQVAQLATDMEDLRYQADQEIKQGVQVLNGQLAALQGVNIAISTAYSAGRSTAELLDQRDELIQGIGEYLDISYFYDKSGTVSVSTNGGLPLVSNGVRYELDYTGQASREAFISDGVMNPISIYLTDENGARTGSPVTLVTGGTSAVVTTSMLTGKIKGLLEMRDRTLPQALAQLDNFAANIRDQFNILHNAGSAYPGANSYTGTRAVSGADFSQWNGKVRMSLLDSSGNPVPSLFTDEESPMRALTIDMEKLESAGYGPGKSTVQTIIDEINSFYQPQNKASLGDINSIRLTSNSTVIPASGSLFSFDFDLENITAGNADFYMTDITVTDDLGADITAISSQNIPQIALAATNTYQTTAGSNIVTINSVLPHGLQNGDTVYLSDPGAPVDGIPNSQLSGFFTISNVTGSSFQIQTLNTAATGVGPFNFAGVTATPKYITTVPGETVRTKTNGTTTLDLSGNPTSSYYTITAQVAVKNADGTLKTGTVSYKVLSPAQNAFNQRIAAESGTGDVTISVPNTTQPLVTAKLVDANGVEIPKLNGAYVPDVTGYLQIKANNQQYFLAIDSLNSSQLGQPNSVPAVAGTNRSFSHYFELNNFFKSNIPTSTGDTVKNSAINLTVEARLLSNPNLISTGRLTQSARPSDPSKPPLYTYERESGDNSVIQLMAGLATNRISFAAAGGLGEVSIDFNGYAGQVIGFASANASSAETTRKNIQSVRDGFTERQSSISGVSLDEELANTIIFQNAYTASARVITVTDELFDVLLNTFGR